MLCYRCEHRVRYLEEYNKNKYSKKETHIPRPRFECGEIELSINACYMYIPVKPIILEKTYKDDPRPISLDILSSRVSRNINYDLELNLNMKNINNKLIPYWEVINVKKK